MKKLQGVFKVLTSEYMNCSMYGNPKKRLILEDDSGGRWLATTATNALCGYYSYNHRNKYLFTYHFTRKNGNMVIDYINQEIKEKSTDEN